MITCTVTCTMHAVMEDMHMAHGHAHMDTSMAVVGMGMRLCMVHAGRLLRAAERSTEAPIAFAAAAALKPTEPLYINGLGTALQGAGRGEEARWAYLEAVRLNPTWASPYRNLGLSEYETGGRAEEALVWFGRTVELDPASAETYCDMGTAHLELGHLVDAMYEYDRALRLEPTNSLARANHVHLSTKLCEWGSYEERHAQLRELADSLLAAVDARRAQPLQPAPHLFLPPYHALSYEGFGPHALRRLSTAYAERAAERSGAATSPRPMIAPAPSSVGVTISASISASTTSTSSPTSTSTSTSTSTRLRVGYLSTDFGDHPTSHLMRSFWQLQRSRRRVHASCFARSNDGSPQRAHIASTCEEFVDLSGLPWGRAADAIRRRRVTILVDLNGHCGRPQFEILSLRPAPLQLTYMGHPGSSGAPYVQYVLVDPATSPPRTRSHFSEAFLSLHQWHVTDYRYSHAFAPVGSERSGGLGDPPEHAPAVGERLEWPTTATRAALGLPPMPSAPGLLSPLQTGGSAPVSSATTKPQGPAAANAAASRGGGGGGGGSGWWGGGGGGFVLATFCQLYKVTPSTYDTWLNALRRAPPSTVLWLLEFPDLAADNLARHAAAAGIATRRLVSAPTAQRSFHLARASLADLFLDTSPYSGHTTTGDALWMGTPVLSGPGAMMQSRVAASYALNAGCPEPVVRSLRAYEGTAAAIASRPPLAAALRTCLHRGRWTASPHWASNPIGPSMAIDACTCARTCPHVCHVHMHNQMHVCMCMCMRCACCAYCTCARTCALYVPLICMRACMHVWALMVAGSSSHAERMHMYAGMHACVCPAEHMHVYVRPAERMHVCVPLSACVCVSR